MHNSRHALPGVNPRILKMVVDLEGAAAKTANSHCSDRLLLKSCCTKILLASTASWHVIHVISFHSTQAGFRAWRCFTVLGCKDGATKWLPGSHSSLACTLTQSLNMLIHGIFFTSWTMLCNSTMGIEWDYFNHLPHAIWITMFIWHSCHPPTWDRCPNISLWLYHQTGPTAVILGIIILSFVTAEIFPSHSHIISVTMQIENKAASPIFTNCSFNPLLPLLCLKSSRIRVLLR